MIHMHTVGFGIVLDATYRNLKFVTNLYIAFVTYLRHMHTVGFGIVLDATDGGYFVVQDCVPG